MLKIAVGTRLGLGERLQRSLRRVLLLTSPEAKTILRGRACCVARGLLSVRLPTPRSIRTVLREAMPIDHRLSIFLRLSAMVCIAFIDTRLKSV